MCFQNETLYISITCITLHSNSERSYFTTEQRIIKCRKKYFSSKTVPHVNLQCKICYMFVSVLTCSNKYLSQHESNMVENLVLLEQNTWGAAYLKEEMHLTLMLNIKQKDRSSNGPHQHLHTSLQITSTYLLTIRVHFHKCLGIALCSL